MLSCEEVKAAKAHNLLIITNISVSISDRTFSESTPDENCYVEVWQSTLDCLFSFKVAMDFFRGKKVFLSIDGDLL